MTIAKLQKILTRLVADGQGRKEVCIDKSTFTHPLEPDGCIILCVESAEMDVHEMLNENGGRKELADGRTAMRTALVLKGCQ